MSAAAAATKNGPWLLRALARSARKSAVVYLCPLGSRTGQNSYCSTYQQDASHELISSTSSVETETPFYNEKQVRDWLSRFPGGSVLLDKDQKTGIAQLTINQESRKNAFTGQMMKELGEHVQELEEWNDGRVLIIKGAGSDFCSGGDLDFVREIANPKLGCRMSIFMQEVSSKIHRLPMLTVSVLNGHALGGGAELSMATDFRVMARGAKIGFVQSRLGVTTGWGGGTHLARLVGSREAFRLLVSGRVLKADDAEQLGLADAVFDETDTEKLVDSTLDWMKQNYLLGYGASTRAVKRMIFQVNECDYAEALNRERDIFTRLWGSESHLHALNNVPNKKKK